MRRRALYCSVGFARKSIIQPKMSVVVLIEIWAHDVKQDSCRLTAKNSPIMARELQAV